MLQERVTAAVNAYSKVRVPLDVVVQAAYASDSSLLTAPDRRERLAQLFQDLASLGSIRLPTGTSSWDHSALPALPQWVDRVTTAKPARSAAAPRAWVDELAFATSTPLTPAERILLARINDFLRDGGRSAELIPLRERSYELFKEEKRLDNLSESRLVIAGLLSLNTHLRAYPTPPPIPIVELGHAPWALIVENSATFSSLRTILGRRAKSDRSEVGWLCLGSGKLIIQSIASLAERLTETGHHLATIHYFGDLDLEGLEIAQRASNRAISLGMPPLSPAVHLYTALLQRPDRSTVPADVGRIAAAARWLPNRLTTPVAEMLQRERCLRQEALPLPAIREVIGSHALPAAF
jgi:hypothetical protein